MLSKKDCSFNLLGNCPPGEQRGTKTKCMVSMHEGSPSKVTTTEVKSGSDWSEIREAARVEVSQTCRSVVLQADALKQEQLPKCGESKPSQLSKGWIVSVPASLLGLKTQGATQGICLTARLKVNMQGRDSCLF